MEPSLSDSTQKTLSSCPTTKGKRHVLDRTTKVAKDEEAGPANPEKLEKRRAQKRTHAQKKRNKEREQRQSLEAKYERLKEEHDKLKMETGHLKLFANVLKGLAKHTKTTCSHKPLPELTSAQEGQKTLSLPAQVSSFDSYQSQVPAETTSLAACQSQVNQSSFVSAGSTPYASFEGHPLFPSPSEATSFTSAPIQSSSPALRQEGPSTSALKAAHNTTAAVRVAPPSSVFRQKANDDYFLRMLNIASEDDEDEEFGNDAAELFAALPSVSFDYESHLLEDLLEASADCSSMRLTVFPEDGDTATG